MGFGLLALTRDGGLYTLLGAGEITQRLGTTGRKALVLVHIFYLLNVFLIEGICLVGHITIIIAIWLIWPFERYGRIITILGILQHRFVSRFGDFQHFTYFILGLLIAHGQQIG